jgi:hypothetical protein
VRIRQQRKGSERGTPSPSPLAGQAQNASGGGNTTSSIRSPPLFGTPYRACRGTSTSISTMPSSESSGTTTTSSNSPDGPPAPGANTGASRLPPPKRSNAYDVRRCASSYGSANNCMGSEKKRWSVQERGPDARRARRVVEVVCKPFAGVKIDERRAEASSEEEGSMWCRTEDKDRRHAQSILMR